MKLISKQEVIKELDNELSKCPNHHVLKILQRLKSKVETMMVNIPPTRERGFCVTRAFLDEESEFQQFKKQFGL